MTVQVIFDECCFCLLRKERKLLPNERLKCMVQMVLASNGLVLDEHVC